MTGLGGAIDALHPHASSFEEEKLLRIIRMFERPTDWHTRRPKFETWIEKRVCAWRSPGWNLTISLGV